MYQPLSLSPALLSPSPLSLPQISPSPFHYILIKPPSSSPPPCFLLERMVIVAPSHNTICRPPPTSSSSVDISPPLAASTAANAAAVNELATPAWWPVSTRPSIGHRTRMRARWEAMCTPLTTNVTSLNAPLSRSPARSCLMRWISLARSSTLHPWEPRLDRPRTDCRCKKNGESTVSLLIINKPVWFLIKYYDKYRHKVINNTGWVHLDVLPTKS